MPFSALRDVHHRIHEGENRAHLYARIHCSDVVNGEIPHDCDASTAPHALFVCITLQDNGMKVRAAVEAMLP